MVNRYLSTKFGVNSLEGFQENEFYVLRGLMTDTPATALTQLTQSNGAKIETLLL